MRGLGARRRASSIVDIRSVVALSADRRGMRSLRRKRTRRRALGAGGHSTVLIPACLSRPWPGGGRGRKWQSRIGTQFSDSLANLECFLVLPYQSTLLRIEDGLAWVSVKINRVSPYPYEMAKSTLAVLSLTEHTRKYRRGRIGVRPVLCWLRPSRQTGNDQYHPSSGEEVPADRG